jgi:serine/threonine protein kinase
MAGVLDSRFVTRYELLDRIGVGGMAEIFRGKAVAAGGFEKAVAIKRILPHLSQDKRFVELLIAEAKVLSLLKHRNIVQISPTASRWRSCIATSRRRMY